MAEPSVFPENLNNPDSSTYKGPRADNDGTAPVTPPPMGAVGGQGGHLPPADQVGSAGAGPGYQSGENLSTQTPWGGPAYDGQSAPQAPGGDGATYGLGATYAPGADTSGSAWGGSADPAWGQPAGDPGWGAGTPAGMTTGTPGQDTSGWNTDPSVAGAAESAIPSAYASVDSPAYTTLAGTGNDGSSGWQQTADTQQYGGQQYGTQEYAPQQYTNQQYSTQPDQSGTTIQSTEQQQFGPVSTQSEQTIGSDDGVSFQHANLGDALSGGPTTQPGGQPTAQNDTAQFTATQTGSPTGNADNPGGGPGADSGGIEVSVDGKVISAGDDAVQVSIGDTTSVTPDPTGTSHTGGQGGDQSGQQQGQQGQPGGEPGQQNQTGQQPGDQRGQVPGQQPGQSGQGQPGQGQPGQGQGQQGAADQNGVYIHGEGRNPANVELTMDKASMGDLAVQVHKNTDGSVDINVPKSGQNGHDVLVHVPPGKDADIELARDADGNLVVRTRPDAEGDNKTGTNPPGTDPNLTGEAGGPGDPNDPNNPDGGPDVPEPPGGGGGAPPGGGGGAPPGGGGGGPSGGGAPPGGNPPGSSTPPPGNGGGQRNADPETIKKLGSDITDKPGSTLDTANTKAGGIEVGFPGFGVLGIPLNMAHDQLRGNAQSYMTSGRETLDSWRTSLNQSANNWQSAEDSSTVQE